MLNKQDASMTNLWATLEKEVWHCQYYYYL